VTLGDDQKAMQTRHSIANERLEAALLRLEKAMVKNAEPKNSANLEKIAVLVQENNKLKDTNSVIEDRLNSAIKNLKNILKEA
jgi:hypothetical protein